MYNEYADGNVQEGFERILPVAANLDDDGEMEVYSFNNYCSIAGSATINNADGFIKNKISVGGGTSYTPIIKQAIKDSDPNIPTFAIVLTDGDCNDRDSAKKAIIEASFKNVFFQFIGIGSEKKYFLQELDTMKGRYIDNAGFKEINDLSSKSDEELYDILIDEFSKWVKTYQTPNKETIKNFNRSTEKKTLFGIFKK